MTTNKDIILEALRDTVTRCHYIGLMNQKQLNNLLEDIQSAVDFVDEESVTPKQINEYFRTNQII